MSITPVDIQQQQFKTVWRGYESEEVRVFLDQVGQRMVEMQREQTAHKTSIEHLERELADHRGRDEILREAVLTTQRAMDDIREHARKEAEVIVAEAEVQAEQIIQSTQSKVNALSDEMRELRIQRARLIEDMRNVLETHNKILDIHTEEGLGAQLEASVTTLASRRRATQSTQNPSGSLGGGLNSN
jgi:cell division initiation protein